MKYSRLLLVNLVLLVLVVAGAFELRRQIIAAGERYQILTPDQNAKEVPQFTAGRERSRVLAADHLPIAGRLLFSRDRNPVIEVEAPSEPAALQRPALPKLVGIMELGSNLVALMAPDAATLATPVETGESVGDFVFLGIEGEKILLGWNGQTIKADPHELVGGAAEAPPPRARSRSAPPKVAIKVRKASEAPKPAKKPPGLGGPYNIGKSAGGGKYKADPKDKSPTGTTYKGLVKRARRSPFGTYTWWEKAK